MNGDRLKQARSELGYTLAHVAKRTGYTISFISQLERNLRQPSLEALRKLADCLECSVLWLLMDDKPAPSHRTSRTKAMKAEGVVRAAERRVVTMPEINTRYEIITPPADEEGRMPKMTGIFLKLKPGCWGSEKMVTHDDMDESVFLIKGKMEALVGDRRHILNAGDNIYIPAGIPHNVVNMGSGDLITLSFFSSNLDL